MDDIFIDNKPEEDYLGADNGGDIDDILNDGVQNVLIAINLENSPGAYERAQQSLGSSSTTNSQGLY